MSRPEPDQVVLELRVHGVRGTPTDSMLGVRPDQVRQVAGDGLTGFYRIADGISPPKRQLPPTMALEAYSWGQLTSGVRGLLGWVARVLWLALLPFALANLAFWARTQAGRNSGQARWGLRAVRVSAIVLTVIAILTPCFVAIDLIAWQCFRANAVACPVLPGPFDAIAALSAGQRIAVMSLVPLGALGILVGLSFQSLARYEAAVDDRAAEPVGRLASILEHPLMWRGEQRTRRLQRLHVIAALTTVTLFTGIHLVVREGSARLWPTTGAAMALLALVLVRSLAVDELDLEHRARPRLVLFGQQRRPPTGPGDLLRRLPLTALTWIALAVTAAHLVVLWTIEVPVDAQDRAWVGSSLWFVGLFVVLTILHVMVFVGGRMPLWGTLAVTLALVALAVVGGWVLLSDRYGAGAAAVLAAAVLLAWALLLVFHYRRSQRPENRELAWGGAGASVLLGAATMVALLYTSAVAVAAANYLNGGSQSVADLITVRNETSPVSAQGERQLTADGEVVLDGARVVIDDGAVRVTGGTIRADALTRASEGLASYALASTMVDRATLLLPPETTTVRLVASCFGRADDPSYRVDEACTGESAGFRTAGALDVPRACLQDGTEVPCLRVEAAGGRVELAVSDPPQTPLVVPQVLVWTPLMQLLLLVFGGVVVAAMLLRFGRRVAPAVRSLTHDDDPVVPPGDRSAVADARVRAALAHRAERLLDGLGVVTTALAVLTLALSAAGRPPWAVLEQLRPVATLSLYVALATSAGLMIAGAQVRKSPTARRTAGILWDVTTFWPRAAHPFAPPCYAERVVPEITARVRWALADDPSRAVVLSGHSQGSLICAAVACRLQRRERQLRLLTYGSQIRAIYGRVFPAAAGPRQLGYAPTEGPPRMGSAWPEVPDSSRAPQQAAESGLRSRLAAPGHWVNLVRRADPLGYRVYSDQDSDLDRVTLEVRPVGSGDPGALILTHGGYQHSPEYREAIAQWTGEQVQEPAVGPVDADPLPPA